MKKQAKVWVSILILFSFLLPAFYHADAARVAIIKDVKGEVYIKKGNSTREFKAKEGMSLSEGDSVRTVKKSSANILYDDESKTTVAPSSKLTIAKLKTKDEGNKTKVKVVSGKVWNSVKNLSNSNDEYDVETPTAVMGVRGTHFMVVTDPLTGQTTVTVLDGTVGVSQNSDSSSSTSGSGPSGQPEQLVTFNQTLTAQSPQQAVPEAKTLDVKQLIEQVEPEVLVEIIQDLTNAIKEAHEQAIQNQQQFDLTKQQDLIEKAVELSKTASTLAGIQEKVLNEINQSEKKAEVEELLQTNYQQTLQKAVEENNQLKDAAQTTQQQAEKSAKETAGMTQEQIDNLGPKTGTEDQNPGPQTPDNNGGGNNDGGPTTPPPSPIGTPIIIGDPSKPVTFTNGVTLDLKGVSLTPGTTVTVTELPLSEQSPELNGKGLKPAGKIIEFTFVGGTISQPVEIKLPLQSGIDGSNVGIFYLNDNGNWEYQPSTVESGTVKAIVSHFSTYGVLEAGQAPAPTVKVNGEIATPDVETLVDVNSKMEINSSPGSTVYYENELGEKHIYNPDNPPVITGTKTTFEVYSTADNVRDSERATYTFITRPSTQPRILEAYVTVHHSFVKDIITATPRTGMDSEDILATPETNPTTKEVSQASDYDPPSEDSTEAESPETDIASEESTPEPEKEVTSEEDTSTPESDTTTEEGSTSPETETDTTTDDTNTSPENDTTGEDITTTAPETTTEDTITIEIPAAEPIVNEPITTISYTTDILAATRLGENSFSFNLANLPADARFTEVAIIASKETDKLSVDLGEPFGIKVINFSEPDGEGKRKATISPNTLGLDPQNDGISLKILKLYIQGTTQSDSYEVPGTLNDSVEVKLKVTFNPNHPPIISETISDQYGNINVPIHLDVSTAFTDPDGHPLTLQAQSSNNSIATVNLIGEQLQINPLTAGATTVTLTATDSEGYSISQSFNVTVQMPIKLDWQGYTSPIEAAPGMEKQISFTSSLNNGIEQLSNIGYVFKWSKNGSVLGNEDINMDKITITDENQEPLILLKSENNTSSGKQFIKLSNEYYLLKIDNLTGSMNVEANPMFIKQGLYDLDIYAVQLNN